MVYERRATNDKRQVNRSKFIFLDRDGVINKDPGGWTKYNYVTEADELQFLPGSLEALAKLNRAGYDVVIVSNQAGVGKGNFTKRRLDEINSLMAGEIKRHGGSIRESFYCIHRRDENCNCRKPKPGLLEMAIRKYKIDPRQVFFVGDSEVDVGAGQAVGMPTILVLSGKTSEEELKKFNTRPDHVFEDLLKVVDWMLAKERRKAERAIRRVSDGQGRER